MSKGTIEQLRDMIKQDVDCKIDPEMCEFYYASDIASWENKTALVGDGNCTTLVQAATGAPPTSWPQWIQGPKVKGNGKIPSGTAIASGWVDGKYISKPKDNHAAIFVKDVDGTGIVVVDQWKHKSVDMGGERPSKRTLKYDNRTISNGGDYFSVVVTRKHH